MTALFVALALFAVPQQSTPADSITLQYCYNQAEQHYPEGQKKAIQHKIAELNEQIVHSAYFPNVSVQGKASYQSEVTEFGMPGGFAPPAVSKDQYEAAIQINQNIYSGGAVGVQKKLAEIKGEQSVLNTEIEMQQIRAQIDAVYFGILLAQQQTKGIQLFTENLRERLKNVRSKVENGVLLKSQQLVIEAELLGAAQDSASTISTISAGYHLLGELIGEKISTDTKLGWTHSAKELEEKQPAVNRPELAFFEMSNQLFAQQEKSAFTQKLPNVSAFGTLGYGRPGFNFMNDDFHDYYMVGLRVSWDLLDVLNAGKKQQIAKLKQQEINQDRRAFETQLSGKLGEIRDEISVLEENILRDEKIITKREYIVKEQAQLLEKGVITATEYITELTGAHRARLLLYTHKVKLAKAKVALRTAMGLDLN